MIRTLIHRTVHAAIDAYDARRDSTDRAAVRQRLDRIEQLRGLVVRESLARFLTPTAFAHFSICDLESIINAAGVVPHSGILKLLRPLHCMNWGDMSPQLQQEVVHHVLALFDIEPRTESEFVQP